LTARRAKAEPGRRGAGAGDGGEIVQARRRLRVGRTRRERERQGGQRRNADRGKNAPTRKARQPTGATRIAHNPSSSPSHELLSERFEHALDVTRPLNKIQVNKIRVTLMMNIYILHYTIDKPLG
jgi:hypothetical protein